MGYVACLENNGGDSIHAYYRPSSTCRWVVGMACSKNRWERIAGEDRRRYSKLSVLGDWHSCQVHRISGYITSYFRSKTGWKDLLENDSPSLESLSMNKAIICPSIRGDSREKHRKMRVLRDRLNWWTDTSQTIHPKHQSKT
jgi:hypothetical protein